MGTIRAFMYHDIRDLDEKKFEKRYSLKSFLNLKQFEYQIEIIRNKYNIIRSLDLKSLDLNCDLNFSILTFDDGLKDHYYVAEYLHKNKINGTFLIPRMPIVESKVMNTHKIQFVLSVADEKLLTKEILDIVDSRDEIWNKYSKSLWKNNWWSREMVFVTNFLRNFKGDKQDNYEITDFLFKKYVTSDEKSFSNDLYLDKYQIERISDMNMVIGGHGDISENLLNIANYDDEIRKSKEFISKYTNEFVFSYPNGGFNDSIKNSLNSHGFEISFTTIPRTLSDLDDFDLLEFPRYDAPQKINLP